jgi:hypothetical protein
MNGKQFNAVASAERVGTADGFNVNAAGADAESLLPLRTYGGKRTGAII